MFSWLFNNKPRFRLEFSSEILKCRTKNCLQCGNPCELMKRKDIRFLHSGRSTGSTKWDSLLRCISSDNVSITRADLEHKPRKYCEYIFELIHKVRPDRAKNRKIPVYRRVGYCVILSGVKKELKIMELETVTDYG